MMIRHFDAPPLNRKEIYKYARMGAPTEETEALMDACLAELLPHLSYQICYKILPIDRKGDMLYIDAIKTSSSLAHKALEGCTKVIVFAATIGLAPDRLIRRYSLSSPARALLLQAIGSERVESLCDVFCKEIEQSGCVVRPRFSVGYGDLPLSLQQDIFKILECNKIGISLGESLLMTPSKSVTALIGIKEETK